jgi:pimeloyl-ACP methyl ester carboxylesterase
VRFVLVHGAYHGAWCWDRLIPELEHLGHNAVAIDLPGCTEQPGEVASHATWRATFRDVVQDGDVLVGHSMGGFAVSLAADEVPDRVARLIYLAAAAPNEGETMGASLAETVANLWPAVVGMASEEFTELVDLPHQGPSVRLTKQAAANALFYHDCTPEDQDWAWEHLTALPIAMAQEPFHLPRFWEASILRDYVVATDDRCLPPNLANEFMSRLGLSTAYGIVASHSPFISRPADTAKLLDVCSRGTLA